VERIKAGMRRRRLEGYRLGRAPLDVDRDAIVRDRLSGKSLTETAKKHGVSRASVVRFVHEARRRSAPVEQFQPVSVGVPVQLTA
jgi:DNA invertase Pin-like site-specific DNA recombinase